MPGEMNVSMLVLYFILSLQQTAHLTAFRSFLKALLKAPGVQYNFGKYDFDSFCFCCKHLIQNSYTVSFHVSVFADTV